MFLLPLVLSIAPALDGTALDDAPERNQFDFWIGEWSVQNRHLQSGAWVDGNVTRARITPVLNGDAILEEWSGPLWPGKRMSGYSLRSFDPKLNEWVILLNWSQDGGSSFGTKNGTFRHGRGEFISSWKDQQGRDVSERYTFSDALANSCRWDQARSYDKQVSWRTDWIMEFSRTAPAKDMSFERVLGIDWPEGDASPHEEARALDRLAGTWGELHGPARIRCGLICEKRLLVLQVEEAVDGEYEAREFWTLSWVPAAKSWIAWSLRHDDTSFVTWRGTVKEDAVRFVTKGDAKGLSFEFDGEELQWTGVGDEIRTTLHRTAK